jgi:hypothetical protein
LDIPAIKRMSKEIRSAPIEHAEVST